jgi:hypothetical protein
MGNKRRHHNASFKAGVFSAGRKKAENDQEELEAECYLQVGQLKVELEWLNKISGTRFRRKGPRSSLVILRSRFVGSVNSWDFPDLFITTTPGPTVL